ncbi:MAG TPA: NAD(P)-dependent oxidoreductase [Methylomirabilota bacterium]|nr:NAD(P)-dependent oxidoreductase [Methylomirabilota bacterium]
MAAVPVRALVVGDRFIRADLFANALDAAAERAGLPVAIERLQLDYPAVDAVSLPTTPSASAPRPLWEDPAAAAARADADLAADPTIREYTGPVDLLAPYLADVEALILHLAPLSRAAVAAAPRLRVVGCARGGAVNLNLTSLNERGVPVFFCPGRNARAVAEYVMGAVLAFARGIAAGREAIAAGLWRLDLYTDALAGPEFAGRACGLIGFGGVGRAFVPIAQGFGMSLLIHDPYVDAAVIQELGAEAASLDEVLRRSDLVVLAARLTDETRGLIGGRELGLLRRDAIFVNPARAELVDGVALREALARRTFGGAIIDVFSPEPPLADDPLLTMDNVLLTPHLAGATRQAAARGAEVVCRQVVAHLVDGTLEGSLNRQALPDADAVREEGR